MMTTGTVDGPEGTWPLQVSITPGGSTGIEVESFWGVAGGGYCSDFLGGVGCSANPNEGNRMGKLITLTLIRCAFPFGE